MNETVLRRYIFASDFDQTLTFNDSGYVLAELVGIPTEEFERKAKGMAKINLVQQGAELAYIRRCSERNTRAVLEWAGKAENSF
jgi:hypothetical protein